MGGGAVCWPKRLSANPSEPGLNTGGCQKVNNFHRGFSELKFMWFHNDLQQNPSKEPPHHLEEHDKINIARKTAQPEGGQNSSHLTLNDE